MKIIYNKIILPRDFKITYFLLNKNIYVYNGKKFHEFIILKNMIGYKVGEFSSTKNEVMHKNKKQ